MEYNTILDSSYAEFIEKRSRFIANIKHIETEKEATDYIYKIKTKYWDARHNVFSYIVKGDKIYRYTDDGEPSGTAGLPILDLLRNNNLQDIVVVVTRYFGGTLLGTGGLVRAYSHCTKLALDNAKITTMLECHLFSTECNYSIYNKITSLIFSFNGNIIESNFSDTVNLKFYVPIKFSNDIVSNIKNLSCGSLIPVFLNKVYMPKNI